MQPESGRESDCIAVQDQAHDFVLSKVSPDEEQHIEHHLAHCSRCREYIDELANTVSLLAFTSKPVAPPASAKAALFARIAQASRPADDTPGLTAGSLDIFRTPSIPASSPLMALPASTGGSSTTSGKYGWSRLFAYAAPLATLPLLLALGFVGYWGVSTRMDLNDKSESVNRLNATVELLNNKVDSLSVGMDGFEQYLNPETSKHYAMLDPSPSAGDGEPQPYGLLLTLPSEQEAVIMTWSLDPAIGTYEIMIQQANGATTLVADLFTDNEGDAFRRVDLGVPISQIVSVHVRPKSTGIQADSTLPSAQPDALFATIWPGLNGAQDTFPLQSYP